MKRAIVSVINDLSTDQRVHKHCLMLTQLGYDVLLIGRNKTDSVALDSRQYKTHRMTLPFEKGPLFYASYNIGLFVQLLLRKSDLLFSNDLDTLMPNFLVSRIRGIKLVYDSHEYFTEVPELVSRPRVQNIWKRLESWMLPKLKNTLTVNSSIASLYRKTYGAEMLVLRNIPNTHNLDIPVKNRTELGLPEDKKLVILQGSGINVDRGAEEAVEAMSYLKDVVLLIIGSGDVVENLKRRVGELKIERQVIFKGRMPYANMMTYTKVADLGLTLDKDTNVNYRFSLPNKLFDYIYAGIPTLASDLVEVKGVIQKYQVGDIFSSHNPQELASKMKEMLSSPNNMEWKKNCTKAATELTWEKESKGLVNMIKNLDG